MNEPLDCIEVRPAIRRLLERLAKRRAHDGVVPSVGAVVATLAETEAARAETEAARAETEAARPRPRECDAD
jgi:hypothetical protein